MIETLYQIGVAIKDHPRYSEYFQPWGNPFPGREEEAKVLVIKVEKGNFVGLMEEAFRSKYLSKYLFREGSTKGQATNSVPTIPFTDKKKSFAKIKQSFKTYGHKFIDKHQLDKVEDPIMNYEFDKNRSYLLTFKIDGKYFGEIEFFKNLFIKNAYKGFYVKNYSGEKRSKANNYIGAITGKKAEVYGFVNTLGFTVDSTAFMRNGFNQSEAYKMFPVSKEAVKILDGARKLVFHELSHSFSGNTKYILLPKFIFSNRRDLIREVFELFIEKKPLDINVRSDAADKGTNGFINNTESIIDAIIQDEKLNNADVYYELLFYEKDESNSKLSLFLQLSDIRPSRMKTVMNTKKQKERFYASLTTIVSGKKQYNFNINLFELQKLLLTEQGRSKKPHPFFYRIVEAIFYGEKVRRETFEAFLIQNLKKAFKQLHDDPFGLSNSVIRGFVIYQFIESLGLFYKQKSYLMEQDQQRVEMDAMQFIKQHPSFFTSDYKKGAFLFGCLIARLLYNQPGNAFLNELRDLSIDQGLIEKKFPKLIAKLRQYGHEFLELEQNAATFLASNDKVSKDEISFATTLGMILQKEFDIRNKKITEKESEQGVKFELIDNN